MSLLETWNSKWNEILNDKAEIVCALWNKWNHKIWNDIQNQNQVRHFKMNTSTIQKKKNLEKKIFNKIFRKKFFKNFFFKKISKQNFKKNSKFFFSKKISWKKFFFKKNFQKKKISSKKKISKKISCKKKFLQKFFLKNRICQTEFSNATKHLQKSNRHKESFFPTLACVTWPDLSPEL